MIKVNCCVVALVCVACGGADPEGVSQEQSALATRDLEVDFAGCTEFAGIGFVPAENARRLVPASYTLAGDATNAVIVVRASHCQRTSLLGLKSPPGTLSQIGVSLVGPDTTADINNYTLWYTTSDPLLAAALLVKGIRAEFDPHLRYAVTPNGTGDTLSVEDKPLLSPAYSLLGPVVAPADTPVTFTASWWQNGPQSTSQMRTVFPAIHFGSGTVTLSTDPRSALGRLIGGGALSFPLLDSYNAFDSAHMVVRRSGG